jgi:hypothetical protein
LITALAVPDLAPFAYLVDDVSLTVTFSPADVSKPKPDVDTLLTLPIDPPAAGPDRALDPPRPGTGCPGVAAGEVAVVTVPEPALAVALAMPYAPPPVAMAVPMAIDLANLRENMWH